MLHKTILHYLIEKTISNYGGGTISPINNEMVMIFVLSKSIPISPILTLRQINPLTIIYLYNLV